MATENLINGLKNLSPNIDQTNIDKNKKDDDLCHEVWTVHVKNTEMKQNVNGDTDADQKRFNTMFSTCTNSKDNQNNDQLDFKLYRNFTGKRQKRLKKLDSETREKLINDETNHQDPLIQNFDRA